jgi:hypothetical protein
MTPTTYRTLRLEFAVAMIASGVALLAHWNQINWPAFIALFSYIDIIGYIPGAIAWRRNHGRLDTRVYHVLYNATHNFLTAGAAPASGCSPGGRSGRCWPYPSTCVVTGPSSATSSSLLGCPSNRRSTPPTRSS